MKKKITEILNTWYKHFELEDNQYSEFELSDIDYFVGCMLYNHFAFSKALDTMKTMDLSYDFLENCGDDYEKIKSKLEGVELDDDMQKLTFLQEYISEVKSKYTQDELYLLNRLDNHIESMAKRYFDIEEVQKVEFKAPELPKKRSPNPLLR